MRNALGPEFGGSGHPPDLAKYKESVKFWKKHATMQ